jgi:hypothetical protein
MSDTEKAWEKGDKAERKAKEAMPFGNKKSAVVEAVVVEKAASSAHKAWQLATQAKKKVRGELLVISQGRSNLRMKEADLQRLREAAAVVALEDEDSEVEEVDEEEAASNQDSHDPCAVALTNLEARYEAGKGGVQAACNLAVEAAADVLCAAARVVIVKALERARKQSAATPNRVAARGHVAAPLVDVSNLF